MEPPFTPIVRKITRAQNIDEPLSPIVCKVVGEVVAKPKRSFSRPIEICLEEWWLSKPKDGKGLAVSGRPIETRRCDNSQQRSHSAPVKRRFASREFHSTEIMKRHGCTTLETSDGFIVSLCGFLNKYRTQHNGFSSEVWRDFIYGFPYNWEDYVTSSDKESISVDPKEFSECFVPAALEACNGAQLHGLVLSLTDAERDLFNKKVSEDLIGMLNLQNQGDADVNNFEASTTYSGLVSKKEAALSKEDPSIAIAAPHLV